MATRLTTHSLVVGFLVLTAGCSAHEEAINAAEETTSCVGKAIPLYLRKPDESVVPSFSHLTRLERKEITTLSRAIPSELVSAMTRASVLERSTTDPLTLSSAESSFGTAFNRYSDRLAAGLAEDWGIRHCGEPTSVNELVVIYVGQWFDRVYYPRPTSSVLYGELRKIDERCAGHLGSFLMMATSLELSRANYDFDELWRSYIGYCSV